ncbi:unnamed protein product [Arctia plantaginis]|uniref:Uncharacterized protein n=1 Tax=Arctia plantaginis TaxID=874455 RepID=A0A8S1AWH1_ARCPL|nr:unnamed protein product [Arctia plantaginis]
MQVVENIGLVLKVVQGNQFFPEISTNNEVQIIRAHDSSVRRKVTKGRRGKPISRIYSTEVSVLARQVQSLRKAKTTYAIK